jgi:hypothetical protein
MAGSTEAAMPIAKDMAVKERTRPPKLTTLCLPPAILDLRRLQKKPNKVSDSALGFLFAFT